MCAFHCGDKKNVLSPGDLVDNILFVTDKLALDLKFVQYHAALHFRAFSTFSASAWVHSDVSGSHIEDRVLSRNLGVATILYRAMCEMESVGEHLSITISKTVKGETKGYHRVILSEDSLHAYKTHFAQHRFPWGKPGQRQGNCN